MNFGSFKFQTTFSIYLPSEEMYLINTFTVKKFVNCKSTYSFWKSDFDNCYFKLINKLEGYD